MVKKIMRDPLFLAQKATDATEADQQVITQSLMPGGFSCRSYYEIKTGNYKLLERKIYTFWERNHIFGIRIPVAGGNEPSVCLPELKVPEDSQQEAGY